MEDFDILSDCLFDCLIEDCRFQDALDFASFLYDHGLILETDFRQYVACVALYFV